MIDPAGVGLRRRYVDAQADQDVMLEKEVGPLFVQHHAIGLEGVCDLRAGPGDPVLDRDNATKKN